MIYYGTVSSPIGELTILSDGEFVTGVHVDFVLKNEIMKGDLSPIVAAKDWLKRYWDGKRPSPRELPIRAEGTEFQKLIWSLLLEIPYGKTTTYGCLAKQAAEMLGKPRMSAQAVGGAVGKNPLLIVIPCHRVLGANGTLTGFSAGLERKITLLKLERI